MSNEMRLSEDDRVRAGEYALGLLSVIEAVKFERRLSAEPQLRAVYEDWAQEFPEFRPDTKRAGTGPAIHRIRSSLLPGALPNRSKQEVDRRRQRWTGALKGGLIAAECILAAAIVGFLLLRDSDRPVQENDLQAHFRSASGAVLIHTTFDPDSLMLRIDPAPGVLAVGPTHEVWIKVPYSDPISIGVLSGTGQGEFKVPAGLASQIGVGALMITRNDAGAQSPHGPSDLVLAQSPPFQAL